MTYDEAERLRAYFALLMVMMAALQRHVDCRLDELEQRLDRALEAHPPA